MQYMPMPLIECACGGASLFSAAKNRSAESTPYALDRWRQQQIPPHPPFSKGGTEQVLATQTSISVIHTSISVIQPGISVMRTVNALPPLKKGATGDLLFGMQASRHQ
jgi:hypothetical protein